MMNHHLMIMVEDDDERILEWETRGGGAKGLETWSGELWRLELRLEMKVRRMMELGGWWVEDDELVRWWP